MDFYQGNHRALFPERPNLTKHDFTRQLSDHLPLWIQIDIDVDGHKLDQVLNPRR